MIDLKEKHNKLINEWGYSMVVNKEGLLLSISNDFSRKKCKLDDQVSFIKHPTVPDGEIGKVKKIIAPSHSTNRKVLLIERQDQTEVYANLEQVA